MRGGGGATFSENSIQANKDSNLHNTKSIESKTPESKNQKAIIQESISLECKAFYESILYYLRESQTNNNIHFIILSDTIDFYIIEAKEYERLCDNKEIQRFFKNCDKKEGNDTSTKKFYKELESILPKLDATLKYTHFNIKEALQDYAIQSPRLSHKPSFSCHSEASASCHSEASAQESKHNISHHSPSLRHSIPSLRHSEASAEETKNTKANILPLIYQVLSPQVLLKQRNSIDANTLNVGFYNELLHILGLKEKSENGKIVITANQTQNSLFDSIHKAFNLNPQSDFEVIFSLLTTWNNRLLFLRLLESMLLSFKHRDKPFLYQDSIQDFSTLNTLFFEVLAKKERGQIPRQFQDIPYLNSSLFDKTELEKEGKTIDRIQSNQVKIYENSIIYKDKALLKSLNIRDNTLPLIEYIFTFLHAYNFTTTPKDIVNHTKTNHDRLINSAVLGLVFEKLNGYKEGSFYTPSFITSYMCKTSITKVVLDRFNDTFKWNAKELKDISHLARENDKSQKDLLQTLLSIKVCDPSVGSGHFLVSVLNEIVLIAYKIGLLESFNMKTTLQLENDEILIEQDKSIFNYQKPSSEDEMQHKIQKELFTLKKEIIESCLFGVDINPNSCEITKLRLWIELLKYSYYKDIEKKELETLPNIDINIKCGNSLVSYFALDFVFGNISVEKSIANNIKNAIDDYKEQVNLYKNALVDKAQIAQKIESIKAMFQNFLLEQSNEYKAFLENLREFVGKYGDSAFDIESAFGMEVFKTIRKNNIRFQPTLQTLEAKEMDAQGEKLLQSIQKGYDYIESIRHKNSLEWRFAFPEVLNSNGDFLGFDLIIGNPPYMKEADNKNLFLNTKKLRTYQGKMDMWYHFVGMGFDIVKKNCIVTFIATNNWTTNAGAKKLRNVILKESKILNLLDFGSYMCFESASIQTMIMTFQKLSSMPASYEISYSRINSKKPTDEHRDAILNRKQYDDIIYLNPTINPKALIDKPITFTDSKQDIILEKMIANGKMFLDNGEIAQGIVPNPDCVTKRNLDYTLIEQGVKIGDGVFVVKKDFLETTNYEKQLLKPLFEPTHCQKYFLNTNNDKEIIYTTKSNCDIHQMPNIARHLIKFRSIMDARRENINGRLEFFHLHWARNKKFFEKGEKILCVRKCIDYPIFSYTQAEAYVMLSVNIIQTTRIDMKLLTGILNSKLIAFWLRYKGKLQGNNYQIDKEPLMNIPIPKINSKNKNLADKIISLVEQILESKAKDSSTDTKELESQIDELVYNLYGLSDSEIRIIEA